MTVVNLATSANEVKIGGLQDFFDKNVHLMEAVNKRAAAQGKAIVDNRTLLIERFKTF